MDIAKAKLLSEYFPNNHRFVANLCHAKLLLLIYTVPVSNSFSELPITDNAQGNYQPKEKKPSKPPPIILYGVEDVNKLTEFLETTVEISTFNYKIINKNQIRIITKDVNIYKNLISRIREKGLIGHTFNIKEERSYRLVIKNLHHTTPHNDIIDAFRETGNTVVGEIINARFGPEKKTYLDLLC
ncbi:unnamed protein product [Euphydryas editha]|uniref:Pre-C2HC domain-containing protein n=1 Tax=Euphydryas editha TaxID=104508 RepID=A0AAU9UIB5_EUPED|nr:unnamed protein product [Euphydryas editha]